MFYLFKLKSIFNNKEINPHRELFNNEENDEDLSEDLSNNNEKGDQENWKVLKDTLNKKNQNPIDYEKENQPIPAHEIQVKPVKKLKKQKSKFISQGLPILGSIFISTLSFSIYYKSRKEKKKAETILALFKFNLEGLKDKMNIKEDNEIIIKTKTGYHVGENPIMKNLFKNIETEILKEIKIDFFPFIFCYELNYFRESFTIEEMIKQNCFNNCIKAKKLNKDILFEDETKIKNLAEFLKSKPKYNEHTKKEEFEINTICQNIYYGFLEIFWNCFQIFKNNSKKFDEIKNRYTQLSYNEFEKLFGEENYLKNKTIEELKYTSSNIKSTNEDKKEKNILKDSNEKTNINNGNGNESALERKIKNLKKILNLDLNFKHFLKKGTIKKD